MSTQPSIPVGLPETGFVRQSQLIPGILPFSSATLWRLVRAGRFPAPVRLADRITAWRTEDVRQWIGTQKFEPKQLAISPPRKTPD
jgi:prophage regulatory protein